MISSDTQIDVDRNFIQISILAIFRVRSVSLPLGFDSAMEDERAFQLMQPPKQGSSNHPEPDQQLPQSSSCHLDGLPEEVCKAIVVHIATFKVQAFDDMHTMFFGRSGRYHKMLKQALSDLAALSQVCRFLFKCQQPNS